MGEKSLRILAYNSGHDGAVAFIEDGRLSFSIEAEKGSNYRHSSISVSEVLDVVGELSNIPDVICMSGWWPRDHFEFLHGSRRNGGYRGTAEDLAIRKKGRFLRGRSDYFSSSHERSHVMCALGMSPLPKGTPCYALVWEGEMGTFYEIDAHGRMSVVKDVLTQPGNRYALLYGLADPDFPKDGPYPRQSDAGKLMALASFSNRAIATAEEQALLEFLLDGPYRKLSDYPALSQAPHLDVGVEDASFRDFAGIYSNAIFARFEEFARAHLHPGRPLLIAGGCGLNCDWNSKWADSGLFSHVFVPPVANDSGSAIGTAIDAQFRLTGDPTIEWDVYAGLPFRDDVPFERDAYDVVDRDDALVADLLANDCILGWAHGRYEIGPRALGNRSILAAPFRDETRVRLNVIKQREQFRPIAPVCLRDEAEKWFGCRADSLHMLFTFQATTDRLRAVTHVNGTARLQTVTEHSNRALYALLSAFRTRTGYGVLCNTSLNFKGKGFINDIGDLDVYTREHGLDGFVTNGRIHLLRSSPTYVDYLRRSSARTAPAAQGATP